MDEIIIKTRWPDTKKYSWHKQVTLTKPEGATLELLLTQHSCANVSQLCKKIVRGELLLTKAKPD